MPVELLHAEPFDDQSAEVERYELREPIRYSFEADRRDFLQTLGAGGNSHHRRRPRNR